MHPFFASSRRRSMPVNLFAAITLTLVLHYLLPLSAPHRVSLIALLWSSVVSVLTYFWTRPLPVLLLDYSCYCPEADHRCNLELCEYFGMRSRRYTPESADFMRAIYRKSGLGDETYAPPYIFQRELDSRLPYAIVEADDGMCSAVAALLSKTSVAPDKISNLIVACSMFSPVPSLASRIVNRFQFRSDVKSFNLSGMGCSTGALGMDLAARILRRSPGYALLVVTEATGLNCHQTFSPSKGDTGPENQDRATEYLK